MPLSPRQKTARHLRAFTDDLLAKRDIYIFGLGSGASTVKLLRALEANRIPFHKLWAFDSFLGLPEEKPGLPTHSLWTPGNYQFDEKVARKNLAINMVPGKYDIIAGQFENTLTPQLAQKKGMQPASLIDVDVDLYRSTSTLLNWAGENGIVANNTLIYYDDWSGTPEYKGGESMAFMEFLEKFGWQADRVLGGPQPAFRLRES